MKSPLEKYAADSQKRNDPGQSVFDKGLQIQVVGMGRNDGAIGIIGVYSVEGRRTGADAGEPEMPQ